MKKDSRPIFIVPYFGKAFPEYFKLFLKSVEHNPDYQFLCLTDIQTDTDKPNNITIVPYSLHAIERSIAKKFGVPFKFSNPYKLCDFRPAFGLIFEEFIADYSYWGWVDIDLLLGDLDHYLAPGKLISEYDVISFRREWLSGSTAVFRNDPEINRLFMQSPDWKRVFMEDKHFGFDECAKYAGKPIRSVYDDLRSGRNILELKTEVVSFTHVLRENSNCLKMHFQTLIKESISEGMIIEYSSNGIRVLEPGKSSFIKDQEFLNYHFVTERKSPYFSFPAWQNVPDRFFITNTGFHTNLEDLGKEVFFRTLQGAFCRWPARFLRSGLAHLKRKTGQFVEL